MSNLGAYQTVVSLIKKAGGPKQALAYLTGAFVVTSAASGTVGYLVGKKNGQDKKYKVYKFENDAEYKKDRYSKGEKFIVLERDKSTVIIMKKDSMDHPYVVPLRFLVENTIFR